MLKLSSVHTFIFTDNYFVNTILVFLQKTLNVTCQIISIIRWSFRRIQLFKYHWWVPFLYKHNLTAKEIFCMSYKHVNFTLIIEGKWFDFWSFTFQLFHTGIRVIWATHIQQNNLWFISNKILHNWRHKTHFSHMKWKLAIN